jgi:hypothetical protein
LYCSILRFLVKNIHKMAANEIHQRPFRAGSRS